MMYTRVSMMGVNLDIDPIDIPPDTWTEAANMVAEPGRMRRAAGYEQVFPTPLFPPYHLLYSPQLGESYWLYSGTSAIATINAAGAHTDITPAELVNAVDEDSWSGGNLNGIAILNAPANQAFHWYNGLGIAQVLPGLRPNTQYNVMRPFKYHLIGLGVNDNGTAYPDEIHWSDAANPGAVPQTWIPAAENEAGSNILADENGAIVDGLALRDAFYIYKQDTVYEMTYSGGNEVFRFRKVFGTTGVLARNCVVRVKGTHVVLGNGDIYQHDGQNISSIVDGVVRQTFFATIDDDNYRNSFCVYLEPKEEVWFCVPTTGNTAPNLALVWNVTTGKFGYRSIPEADFIASGVIDPQPAQASQAWDDDPDAWNTDTTAWAQQTLSSTEDSLMIANATLSALYKADSGVTADGVEYRATVGRLGLDLQDPQREKAIRRIWPRINAPGSATFTMELFNQRSPMDDTEQVGVYTFQQSSSGVPVNVNARYLGIRIYSDDQVAWDVSGIDVGYMPRGKF